MMVRPACFEEDVGLCQYDTAKFQPLRTFLRRNRKSLLALTIAGVALLSYAGNASSLRRMLAEEGTGEDVHVDEGGGPTFVFIMGVEGTGHHFIESLLERSPNMKRMDWLGLCKRRSHASQRTRSPVATGAGELFHLSAQFFDSFKNSQAIFNPAKKSRADLDIKSRYDAGVELLKSTHQKFVAQSGVKDPWAQVSRGHDEPFHVAINANSCGRGSMLSYPNNVGPDRALQNFNLDLFYDMCTDAKVQCKHTYIYRDPFDVIKSTSMNRDFNSNTYNSIRLYTSVMQQIHSQMVSFPEKNLGCFGFLDAKGSQLQQDWARFGKLFGWQSSEAVMDTAKAITTKSITPITDEMKAQLVPDRLIPMMRAFENIHHRVGNFCYSSLSPTENQVVPEGGPFEAQQINIQTMKVPQRGYLQKPPRKSLDFTAVNDFLGL
mmetsp:Transcript_5468/g.13711  ORF Transcript_5468/g.13711 Transcript_5468/m.13711 type:complete len:434 (-) Transcript_5468:39-1340(-)